MTALLATLLAFSCLTLIAIYSVLKVLNEVKDLIEEESKVLEADLTKARIENTRLRHRLREFNDDEDIFPSRQHRIVSFKRGDDNGPRAG